MKIALFHNPRAGSSALKAKELVRQFENAHYEVLYVSTENEGWEKALSTPVERAVIAGGDGTVSRLAPWLAGQQIPFCILPLGTANNCARSLGQTHTVESIIAGLRTERTKQLDLGIVTNSEGHRMFIEAFGIGLLPEFMREMRNLEKKKQSKNRLSPEHRLSDALIHLRLTAKKYPEMECELLVDDELIAGSFLSIEIANMALIGPNLQLVPDVDATDGRFDVMWIEAAQRRQLREYFDLSTRGQPAIAPTNARRCQHVLLSQVNAPAHVDGKVFLTMAAPISIRLQSCALRLVDFTIE
jgi:diacylglycerol kinase (ATP)